MQSPTQKLREGSIVFEKPGILSNWAPTTIEFNKFYWNFAHVFYLPMCSKKSLRFISFCLDTELFAKIKRSGFYTLTEINFIKQN